MGWSRTEGQISSVWPENLWERNSDQWELETSQTYARFARNWEKNKSHQSILWFQISLVRIFERKVSGFRSRLNQFSSFLGVFGQVFPWLNTWRSCVFRLRTQRYIIYNFWTSFASVSRLKSMFLVFQRVREEKFMILIMFLIQLTNKNSLGRCNFLLRAQWCMIYNF